MSKGKPGKVVVSTILSTLIICIWTLPVSATQVPISDKLNVAICIDRSGSMKEDSRYEMVTAGVAATLAALPDGTKVTIVLFNDQSHVLVDAERLSDHTRKRWSAAIQGVPSGGTDIVGCVRTALKHVADGGLILLLSDGLQTGTGSVALPMSSWEPKVKALCSEANRRKIKIHTIGLSAKADKILLGYFSQKTAGEYFPVPRPKDLVDKYVEITSIVGKFWRRREKGEFEVHSLEEIITVCTESAEQQGPLTRITEQGTAARVTPSFAMHQAGITARRYKLKPGKYRFEPSTKGSSDLLRPMRLEWDVPKTETVSANRVKKLNIVAKPKSRLLNGLKLGWRMSQGEIQAQNQGENNGQFLLSWSSPPQIGELGSGDLVARQHGFEYRVGKLAVTTVKPPPYNFDVKLSKDSLSPVVWANEREVTLQLTATCLSSVRDGELRLRSTDKRAQVKPGVLKVTKGRVLATVRLRLDSDVTESVVTTLEIVAHADDVVTPLINGKTRLSTDVKWSVLKPQITLTGLPQRTIHGDRDTTIKIPVQLRGKDIDRLGFKPTVHVTAKKIPQGAHLSVIDETNKGKIVDRLVAGTNAKYSIVLDIAEQMPPGEYSIHLTAVPSEVGIPLNGVKEGLSRQFTLIVNPESVKFTLNSRSQSWLVQPATIKETRQLTLTTVTTSGRPLPKFDVNVISDPSLQVVEARRSMPTSEKLVIDYDVSVVPSAWPFESDLKFEAHGDQVRLQAPAKLTITGKPTRTKLKLRSEKVVVVAPRTRIQNEVWLDVESTDKEPLPPFQVHPTTDLPVEITEEERIYNAHGRVSIRYSITVPEQSLPFTGQSRFSITGKGIESSEQATLTISVPRVEIPFPEIRATQEKYPAWWESLRHQFAVSSPVRVTLKANPALWKQTGVQWAIVKQGEKTGKGVRWHSSPTDVEYFDRGPVRELVLRSQYRGTKFLPTSRSSITPDHVQSPVPWWFWAGTVGGPDLILGIIGGWRMSRPFVPGRIEISQLDNSLGSEQSIILGKARHNFSIGPHRFCIRMCRGKVMLCWADNSSSQGEKISTAPRLVTAEGNSWDLELGENVELGGNEEICTEHHRATYLSPKSRPSIVETPPENSDF